MTKSEKSVLVTGAAYGIGRSTALCFAQNGYDVIINYNSSAKEAETTAADCRKHGVQAWAIQADLSEEDQVEALATKAMELVGPLDVLVNNAAHAPEPNFDEITKLDIRNSLVANFVTAALTIRAFVPNRMKPGSVVLNVASIYGLDQSGNPIRTIYSASKAALINLTQTLSRKYAPNIRFNAVAPGFTKTESWNKATEERKQAVINTTSLKAWVEPEDIAETLLFLAQSPHINAETIVVDSGWSKRDNR